LAARHAASLTYGVGRSGICSGHFDGGLSMMFTHRRLATTVAAVVVTSGLALAASVLPAQATAVNRGSLNFNSPPAGQTVTNLLVGGAYSKYLTAKVVTLNGGRAVSEPGPPGYGNSIDFPAYQPANQSPPFAIVSLRNNTSTVDPLNPGTGNFTWQADFSLDDFVGTEAIDGDNIVQRGLSPQRQWKLSVDDHRAQCFVRITANGPLAVTPAIHIPLQTSNISWYRAICNRSLSGVVSLRVYAYWNSHHAWLLYRTATSTVSAAGSLGMTRTIPVSIGGKLNDNGGIQLKPSTDQFNGRIDNVVLTVG
jgi:hypothetical protein